MKLSPRTPGPGMDDDLRAAFTRLVDDLDTIYARHGEPGERVKTIDVTISTNEGGTAAISGCTCAACKEKMVGLFAKQLSRAYSPVEAVH